MTNKTEIISFFSGGYDNVFNKSYCSYRKYKYNENNNRKTYRIQHDKEVFQ